MSPKDSGALERLFAPIWAGGWGLSRVLFALSALSAHWPRYAQIRDAAVHPEVVFTSGGFRWSDTMALSVPQANGIWLLGLVGIGGLLWGGRMAKPGLVWWMICYYPLIGAAGLSARVPERMLLWVGLGLLLGPIGERGLTQKRRSPAGRWFLLIVAAALYGATGFLKATQEPAWWTGEALVYDLVDLDFGLQPVGVWVSAHPQLARPLGWATIALEASFPLLILWRRTNPWILLGCVGMHLGIESMMVVGTLTLATLSMYPVLLHPETAERAWRRLSGRTSATPDRK